MEACSKTSVASLDLDTAELCNTIRSQMSSVLAMAVACKMRLASVPDSSRLVLQSMLPSSSSSGSPSAAQLNAAADAFTPELSSTAMSFEKVGGRRYSGAQPIQAGEPAEARDTHTDQLLQMFSSTLQSSAASPAGSDNSQRELAGVSQLERVREEGILSSKGGLRRQGSSPALLSMGNPSGSLVHSYFKRRASSSALFPVGESNERSSVALASQDSPPSDSDPTDSEAVTSGALVPAAPVGNASLLAGSSVDTTDASTMKSKGGFGILNHTRKFGAWLGKVTQGENVEVTKKDLNVFAPTSF